MGRKWKIKNGVSLEEEVEIEEADEEKELDMSDIAVARRERTNSTAELDLLKNDNYYQLLELGHKIRDVTIDEVTRGYKKAAIKYHPDKKTKGRGQEDVRVLWLKVQRAYETLIDKNGKVKYDSTIPFDNKIPTKEQCVDDEAYFTLYGDAFRRNSVFSKKKPVTDADGEKTCPALGNNDTSSDEVNAFYKFWTNFESWRCFDHFAKNSHETMKQAGDRYERRELEKENATEIKIHSKKEHARMIKLVETARELDPRLRRIAKEAAENKNNKKAEAAKRRVEEKAHLVAAQNKKKQDEIDAIAA